MSFELKNITEADINLQGGNMGGLVRSMYIAKQDDVAVLNLNPDNALEVESIEMKPGKKFVKWYFTPNTGKFSQKYVGEEDGKSFEPEVTFTIPKHSNTIQTQLAFVANASLIVICVDANGVQYIIGDKNIPAKIKDGGPDTGTKYADKNHSVVTFVTSARNGAYTYLGSVEGLIVGEALENVDVSVSANAGTDTVTLTWVDNSAIFDNAEATDTLTVIVENTTTGDTFRRNAVAVRSAETVAIVLSNIAVSDALVVKYWMANADLVVSEVRQKTYTVPS